MKEVGFFQKIQSFLCEFQKSVILNILGKKFGNKSLPDNHIPEFLIFILPYAEKLIL